MSEVDEVYYEEQYVWEYEDAGNELVYYDEDREDYLWEYRDIDGEAGGVDDEDQDAYIQGVGIQLDGEDDSDQQDTLQENEEAEGDDQVYPQEDEYGGSEPGGYDGGGQGPYVSDVDGDKGLYQGPEYYPQGVGGDQGPEYSPQDGDDDDGGDDGDDGSIDCRLD